MYIGILSFESVTISIVILRLESAIRGQVIPSLHEISILLPTFSALFIMSYCLFDFVELPEIALAAEVEDWFLIVGNTVFDDCCENRDCSY